MLSTRRNELYTLQLRKEWFQFSGKHRGTGCGCVGGNSLTPIVAVADRVSQDGERAEYGFVRSAHCICRPGSGQPKSVVVPQDRVARRVRLSSRQRGRIGLDLFSERASEVRTPREAVSGVLSCEGCASTGSRLASSARVSASAGGAACLLMTTAGLGGTTVSRSARDKR